MKRKIVESARIVSIGERAVILDTLAGKYYSCNASGSLVLERLRLGEEPEAIAKHILHGHRVDVPRLHEDIVRFVEQLVRVGIYA